jgi:hypothetical protein
MAKRGWDNVPEEEKGDLKAKAEALVGEHIKSVKKLMASNEVEMIVLSDGNSLKE